MKLIQHYHSVREAEIDGLLLEQAGILTHVSSKHSHSLSGLVTGVFSVGLWVIFDHQEQDARAFLKDNDHPVTSGFSAEQIADIKTTSDLQSHHKLNQFLIYALVALATVIGVLATIVYQNW
ncbi:DUF2007 domain-containing protein [Porticoccaceae bacterium]|nr:DUF2007 domain-containing protein [Porticoccaceae bacterium]MDB2664513.1 DUF2007 domain-containing protein [Porticoccaceae bacterium]